MRDYKFDMFYFDDDKSNEHHLSEIENLTDADYNATYRDKMRCPWCKSPQIGRVQSDGKTYLKTYPKQPHISIGGQMCPYECTTAPKDVVIKYINDLKNKKQIRSMLESVMRQLLPHTKTLTTTPAGSSMFKEPLLIERKKSGKTIDKNVIPHYNFKTWGKNIPENRLLIVYGKVHIELIEHTIQEEGEDDIVQTYLHFKDIKTNKLITSCFKPTSLKIENGDYRAVLLGECRPNKRNGFTYYNLWVYQPMTESMLFESITT